MLFIAITKRETPYIPLRDTILMGSRLVADSLRSDLLGQNRVVWAYNRDAIHVKRLARLPMTWYLESECKQNFYCSRSILPKKMLTIKFLCDELLIAKRLLRLIFRDQFPRYFLRHQYEFLKSRSLLIKISSPSNYQLGKRSPKSLYTKINLPFHSAFIFMEYGDTIFTNIKRSRTVRRNSCVT